MTDIATARQVQTPPRFAETFLNVALAVVTVIVAVSSFAISTPFGLGATFLLSAAVVFVLPTSAPAVIIAAFLLQNMVVAWYTPYVADNEAFDALRGANFVILMAVFGMFLAAAVQLRLAANPRLRPLLIIGLSLGGVLMLYLGLGVVRGLPKDAIVYFRNIVTPVACFYIALVAASTWRIDLHRLVTVSAAFAVAYGYLELNFTMDFLALFHGDEYVQLNIWRQIQSGMWEKALQQTGFVMRGLEDVMTTSAFNLAMFDGILPRVFRIGGPNFHSIAYAYALAIFSGWLLFSGRWLLPLLALPLMLIIGSKGALVMFALLLLARLATALFGPRFALVGVIIGAVLWIGVSILVGRTSDYHVLGLFAGLREVLNNPIGQGLGFGGNLSSTTVDMSWEQAQAQGAAAIPLESALGVLLYQMGIMGLAVYGFLLVIVWASWRAFRRTGDLLLFFLTIGVIAVSANSVLQEEAFFSPLALGLLLLLGGIGLGNASRLNVVHQSSRELHHGMI